MIDQFANIEGRKDFIEKSRLHNFYCHWHKRHPTHSLKFFGGTLNQTLIAGSQRGCSPSELADSGYSKQLFSNYFLGYMCFITFKTFFLRIKSYKILTLTFLFSTFNSLMLLTVAFNHWLYIRVKWENKYSKAQKSWQIFGQIKNFPENMTIVTFFIIGTFFNDLF